MKRRTLLRALATTALASALPMTAFADSYDTSRVVAIGGATTEIVYALGEESRLVARDSTSTFPAAAEKLTDIGYMRALAAEGVLSVQPTLILSEPGAGPPETISVLQAASVPMVLFVLSTQGGRIMASGTNTAADGIISLAGGVNAIDQFEGYRQLTAEAISVAAPDVVLMMDREGDHSSTAEALFAMPEMSTTPAAQAGALVKMDGLLLLGFGPRTPQAAQTLHDALQGQS